MMDVVSMTPYLESCLSGDHDVVMGVTVTSPIVMFLMIIVCNSVNGVMTVMIHYQTIPTQVDEPDQHKVHDLLQHVDHQESGQHQDLRHRKSRVRKCSSLHRCCCYLEYKIVDKCSFLLSRLYCWFVSTICIAFYSICLTSLTSGNMWVKHEVRITPPPKHVNVESRILTLSDWADSEGESQPLRSPNNGRMPSN